MSSEHPEPTVPISILGKSEESNDPPGKPLVAPAEPRTDEAVQAVLDATRALLWISTETDAAAVTRDLVQRLGGGIVPARSPTGNSIPVDVSFGVDEPLLPAAPLLSVPRMLLERHIPAFLRDAQRALELADQKSRLAADAAIDSLTGISNRRMIGRALGRLRPEDTVIMIDLDHFKAINDSHGHSEGDRVLRLFARTLASTIRPADRVGRYGGEEFVVILFEGEADPFLTRVREDWKRSRPFPISFSAGIALGGINPRLALEAADRAMYRAKRLGRDQWQLATGEDYL